MKCTSQSGFLLFSHYRGLGVSCPFALRILFYHVLVQSRKYGVNQLFVGKGVNFIKIDFPENGYFLLGPFWNVVTHMYTLCDICNTCLITSSIGMYIPGI